MSAYIIRLKVLLSSLATFNVSLKPHTTKAIPTKKTKTAKNAAFVERVKSPNLGRCQISQILDILVLLTSNPLLLASVNLLDIETRRAKL